MKPPLAFADGGFSLLRIRWQKKYSAEAPGSGILYVLTEQGGHLLKLNFMFVFEEEIGTAKDGEKVTLLVREFFDSLIKQIRHLREDNQRTKLLRAIRTELFHVITGEIDKKLGGALGSPAETDAIITMWNSPPYPCRNDIATEFAMSVDQVGRVLRKARRTGRAVLEQTDRLAKLSAIRREQGQTKQKKKPRVFDCQLCNYRWAEYLTEPQWQNVRVSIETKACKRCHKLGSVTGY